MKLLRQFISVVLTASPIVWALPALAEPPSISLAQRTQDSGNVRQCISTSTQALRKLKLQSIEADEESVAGATDTARVFIFCNPEATGLIQTVVVAGEDPDENDRLVEAIKKALP